MSQNDNLRSQVLSSIAWLGGSRYIGQLFSWGITIFVIRILSPSDYGLMAMASVSTGFMLMVSEMGLGAAIVQQKNLDKKKISQIFGFIILSHSFIFALLFISSGLIADYFNEPELNTILKTLSFSFILIAFYVIPQSLLIREMKFREKSIADFIITIFSSVSTLVLALKGFGVWSLVLGMLAVHFLNLVFYNYLIPIKYLPSFRFRGIEKVVSFGGYILGSRILWYAYSRADIFVGGRILNNVSIGNYAVALEFSSTPLAKFIPIINQVAFPAFSKIQNNLKLARSHFLKAIRIVSVFLFPAFWGLLVVAPELIVWLIGEKWTDAIIPLQLLCVIMPMRAIGAMFAPMLHGIGRPDLNFLYVGIAAVTMLLAFYIGAHWGVTGICMAWLIGYTIVFIFTLIISLPVIEVRIWGFSKQFLLSSICTSLMVLLIFGVKTYFFVNLPPSVSAISQIIIGVLVYIPITYMLQKELFHEVLGLVPYKFRKVFNLE